MTSIQGSKFALLTAIERTTGKFWKCQCDCGNTTVVPSDKLKSGHTKSCGCLRRINLHTKKPEYSSWQHMKSRCKSDDAYIHLSVCDRWKNSFENFYLDMGVKPFFEASIDRMDNSKGYEPSNCRWASKLLQTVNRTWNSNNTSNHRGVVWDSSRLRWKAQGSLGGRSISKRFENLDDAIAYRKIIETTLFSGVIE